MSRVRLARAFVLLSLASACGHETFDLLPPPEAGDDAATGGTATGGRGGMSGVSGQGAGTGGRSERDAGPLPEPDCPPYQPCRACSTSRDCDPGTWCDTLRHYCAPYCGMGIECYQQNLPVCDVYRNVCVECTIPPHCRSGFTCEEGGKCIKEPDPECFSNEQCMDEDEPVCIRSICQPCSNDFQCAGKKCSVSSGRCESN